MDIRRAAHSTHDRKMRSLYVDFENGVLLSPDDITEREARKAIETACTLIEQEKESWHRKVHQAQVFSELPPLGRTVLIFFFAWFIVERPETALLVLRSGWPEGNEDILQAFATQMIDEGFEPIIEKIYRELIDK